MVHRQQPNVEGAEAGVDDIESSIVPGDPCIQVVNTFGDQPHVGAHLLGEHFGVPARFRSNFGDALFELVLEPSSASIDPLPELSPSA